MSDDLTPVSGLIEAGISRSICRKCGEPVEIRLVSTPDTKDGYGNRMPGMTFRTGVCACVKPKAEKVEERLRQYAMSMVASAEGRLAPGMWRGSSLDQFDWYDDGVREIDGKRYRWGTAHHRDRIERYLATLPERVSKGQGLYFVGNRGMGKSMLMATVLTAAAEQGVAGRFEHCAALCKRATVRGDDGADYLRQLCKVPILGIDDLGTENPQPWNLEALTVVLDSRYADRLPTLVTTNLTSDELQSRYQGLDREAIGRLLDRLMERNHPIALYGESYRKRLREDW